MLQNPCGYADVRLRELRRWLGPLLDELAPDGESFALRLVSDREMRRLNRDYRQRDRPTDVLSFPGEAGEGHLGDVVVAIPTARRQAAERRHPLGREVRLLALHGVLHCLGHDHESDDGTMERLEATLRRRHLDRDLGLAARREAGDA